MILKPKGTNDVFNPLNKKWLFLESVIKDTFQKFNYDFLRTPIFEDTSLFKRKNEFSEMVKKQTYDFLDKSERMLTLRPEITAGSIRSIIENKLYLNKNKKFYYYGPCFRYERPQKNRYREFYQFGVEVIEEQSLALDFEVINLAYTISKNLGLKNLKIKINFIGSNEERNKYSEILKKYFKKYSDNLCIDCKVRLLENPLRILDCKVDNEKNEFKNVPLIKDYLTKENNLYFNNLQTLLKENNIPFEVDYLLVRGLDYYSNLVFEILSDDVVIAGGGRYHSLLKELDGPEQSGIGFAFGADRVISMLNEINNQKSDIYFLGNNELINFSIKVLKKLQDENFSIITDFQNRNFSKRLKDAFSYNFNYLIMIKENEAKNNSVVVKNINTKEQNEIKLNDLIFFLKENKNVL